MIRQSESDCVIFQLLISKITVDYIKIVLSQIKKIKNELLVNDARLRSSRWLHV